MTRALVIGGTLFIGRALVEQLLDRGDDVVVMHRGQGTPWGDRVGEIRCDRNDVAAVQSALYGESFELVFDNVYDWQRGTTAGMVVEAARASARAGGLRRYVFMSSVGAYGDGLDHQEDDPLAPANHPFAYCGHKAESERQLFRLHRAEEFPVATLRPAFIYGPYNPFQREAWFWDRIRAGRPIIVPGDGRAPMQFVHVADVARAAIRVAEAPVAAGRAYNLGNYPPLTQQSWVELLGHAAGREVRTIPVGRERIQAAGGNLVGQPLYFGEFLDPPPVTVKTDRIRQELDFALTPLDTGFAETFDWYQQQHRPLPDFTWEHQLLADAESV
jgi:nucleoside-diphosphate-sugar epimerase